MTTTTLSTASLTVFVGTRTSLGRSQGIYRMAFDLKTGALFGSLPPP
jgi:hypothetical protein